MRSYIKRELRSLQDVEIVDPMDVRALQYVIAIAMVEILYADGLKTGSVAMSVSLWKRIPPNRFNDLWREHYTKVPAFEVPEGGVKAVGRDRLD